MSCREGPSFGHDLTSRRDGRFHTPSAHGLRDHLPRRQLGPLARRRSPRNTGHVVTGHLVVRPRRERPLSRRTRRRRRTATRKRSADAGSGPLAVAPTGARPRCAAGRRDRGGTRRRGVRIVGRRGRRGIRGTAAVRRHVPRRTAGGGVRMAGLPPAAAAHPLRDPRHGGRRRCGVGGLACAAVLPGGHRPAGDGAVHPSWTALHGLAAPAPRSGRRSSSTSQGTRPVPSCPRRATWRPCCRSR